MKRQTLVERALEAADKRLCELTPIFPPDVGPDMRDAEEIEKTGAVVMQIRAAIAAIPTAQAEFDKQAMKDLRPSKETLAKIEREEQANAVGCHAVRNMPIGSVRRMPDFETMPIGTRQAIMEAAQLFRNEEEIWRTAKGEARADLYAKAAERLEQLLAAEPTIRQRMAELQEERNHNGGYTLDEEAGMERFEAARVGQPIGFDPPEGDEAFSLPAIRHIGPKGIRIKSAPLDGC